MSIRAGVRFFRFACLIGLLGSGVLHGCVRVDAARDTREGIRMLVTRDINGVHLQWESELEKGYTVYYREPWVPVPNNTWKELPGAVEIKGTGKLIRLTDDSTHARHRKYRIETLIPLRKAR